MLINVPLIFIAILIIILTLVGRHLNAVRKINSAIEWIKSPPVLPLIGNLNLLKNNKNAIKVLLKISLEYKNIFKVYVGPINPRVFITDVDLFQYFLSSNKIIDKSSYYSFFRNWLNLGLLTNTGEKWQKRRRLITPTFHFKILEQFIEIFDGSSNILVECLKQHDDKGAFDVYPYITLCTLDIICESAMGIKVNAQLERYSSYVKSVRDMANVIMRRILSPIKMYDSLYFFTLDHLKEKSYLKILHGMTDKVIKERREELSNCKSNAKTDVSDDDFGRKKRSPFLDTLIQSTIAGKPLKDRDIREEVDTFMFGGHDTTSSSVSFTLYCLSKNQDVQTKVMEELDNIVGHDKSRPLTYKDLQEMKYLEMVIKETLRLYPPVSIVGRSIKEDVTIDGKFFPANMDVNLLIIGVHRNPDIYPDPLKFDPERFNSHNQADRHPFAYVPFSAGPRNCIGQKYAMLQLKSMLSKVLRHYQVLPVENYEVDLVGDLTLKSDNGVQLKLKSRS